eukprot:2487789-Prymnesium_polylepis.2
MACSGKRKTASSAGDGRGIDLEHRQQVPVQRPPLTIEGDDQLQRHLELHFPVYGAHSIKGLVALVQVERLGSDTSNVDEAYGLERLELASDRLIAIIHVDRLCGETVEGQRKGAVEHHVIGDHGAILVIRRCVDALTIDLHDLGLRRKRALVGADQLMKERNFKCQSRHGVPCVEAAGRLHPHGACNFAELMQGSGLVFDEIRCRALYAAIGRELEAVVAGRTVRSSDAAGRAGRVAGQTSCVGRVSQHVDRAGRAALSSWSQEARIAGGAVACRARRVASIEVGLQRIAARAAGEALSIWHQKRSGVVACEAVYRAGTGASLATVIALLAAADRIDVVLWWAAEVALALEKNPEGVALVTHKRPIALAATAVAIEAHATYFNLTAGAGQNAQVPPLVGADRASDALACRWPIASLARVVAARTVARICWIESLSALRHARAILEQRRDGWWAAAVLPAGVVAAARTRLDPSAGACQARAVATIAHALRVRIVALRAFRIACAAGSSGDWQQVSMRAEGSARHAILGVGPVAIATRFIAS